MRFFIFTVALVLTRFFTLNAQDLVTFEATDGLKITAHQYEIDENYPYILLFHQAGYSKGEYRNTAIKLLKLNYNCLAVDLRSGGEVNFIQNETASEAKKTNKPVTYLDTEKDILAAISWAYTKSNKPVVLFGSSFSASLCLKLAKNNPMVQAVIAFSPGEYFQPDLTIKDVLNGFDKPVFAASTQREYPYLTDLLSGIPADKKTLFKPSEGPGEHGSKALWTECTTSKEYWLALLLFFKQIDKR
jgi:dienelactone hydrolase